MLQLTEGQKVQIELHNLKAGMTLIENDEPVTILEVDIDVCEEYAVSYIFKDSRGETWCGYGRMTSIRTVIYQKGQNVIAIL